MKKLFTFLLLMLCSIGVSWAETKTIYSWESPSGTVTETGGTIAYTNGGSTNRLNYKNGDYYTICLNGKKANLTDATASDNAGHMLLTLDKALEEGDKINITGYITKNESKKASAWLVYETNATIESDVFGDAENIGLSGAIATKTIDVTAEAAGSKTIKFTRGQTGTNLFITKLTITREASASPSAAQTVTVDFASKGFANAEIVESVTQDGVKISFAQGTHPASKPTYYNTGSAIRLYGTSGGSNTMTFTAPAGKTITKIVFTPSGSSYFALTANEGTISEYTWTGKSSSVEFTPTKQNRIQKAEITMIGGPVVISTLPQILTFPDYSEPMASYIADSTWTANVKGAVWTMTGFNNNNNGWEVIKCGRKMKSVTSTITSPKVAASVGFVGLTIEETANVESASIKVFDQDMNLMNSIDITDWFAAPGEYAAEVNGEENYTYRIVINSKAGANGSTTISQVGLYEKDPGKIEIADIATFNALETGTEAELTLKNALVLFAGANDIIVKDATGAIDFYKTGLKAATNQVLNGVIYAKNSPYQGMPELVSCDKTDLTAITVTDGAVVKGTAVTIDEAMKAANILNLVTLKDVTVQQDGKNFYAVSGESKIQIYDKFKIGYAIEDGAKLKSITGIVVPYKETFELAPRTQEDIVLAPETGDETGAETDQDITIPAKNEDVVGISYTIPGTYNAGTGNMLGTMVAKGLKCRTAQEGGKLEINVNEGYNITKLEILGQGNYVADDATKAYVTVSKVEVDGLEVPFAGGLFPDKSATTSATLTVDNIKATESIVLYFDNSNASAGTQLNMNYTVTWAKPAQEVRETETFDFQELCMALGKGGPWAVNDGGDAGFTIGEGETAATMHFLGDYEEQGFVWNKHLAYEYVADRGKFTMRNKNNKKDKNCGMFSWDFAHNFSILDLQNGDKVTITVATGTVNFVSGNVEGVAAGDAVTSDQTYTISTTEKTTRLDIQMQPASLIAKILIEPAGTETIPEIKLTKETLNLIPGATYKLAATVSPASISTLWKSDNEAVATIAEDGTVTAVAAGTAKIINYWQSEKSEAKTEAICEITVADVDLSTYKTVNAYDFSTMGNIDLTISEEAAGAIYNAANKKNNDVFTCTNEGLDYLALQAVADKSGKGWSISEGEGLFLGSGAGRCAAIKGIKAGQIVEIFYTGNGFYTSSDDDGIAKTTLNEGIGRAIYQATEDGMLGFELDKGNYVSKITIYSDTATGISEAIVNNETKNSIYNLQGQKVQKTAKGLYIINGKKVVIK